MNLSVNTTEATFLYGKIVRIVGGQQNPTTGEMQYFRVGTFYDINAVVNGSIVEFKRQRPSYSLWGPEIELDPFKLINMNIVGCMNGTTIEWQFWEPPKLGECPSTTARIQQRLAQQGFGAPTLPTTIPGAPSTPIGGATPSYTTASGES